MDDSALLKQFVDERCEAAFGALVRRYVDLVYSAARRQTHDPDTAQDVTQQVFILLAERARTIRAGEALAGWLLAATRFASLNTMRAHERRRRHEREAAIMQRQQQEQNQNRTEWDEIGPMLDEAVAELRKDDRDIVAMRFFQGCSVADVAAALGVSDHAAQKRLSRAVGRLREFFARRGITTSADALATTMLANAIVAAPAELGTELTAAALSKATLASANVGKGAVAIMATAKTKVAAACAAGILLMSVSGGLVYQHFSGPRSRNVTIAPPPPPTDNSWKPRFRQVYALTGNEVVKRVRAPLIAEREQLLRSAGLDAVMMPRGPYTLVIESIGGELKWRSWDLPEPRGIQFAMKHLANVPLQNIDLPPALANTPVPGDWVVRNDATPEQCIAALSRILSEATGQNGKIVLKQMEHEAIVASGEFEYRPLKTEPKRSEFTLVHFFTGPLDRAGVSMHAAQNPSDMLMYLGELTMTPVVIDSKLLEKSPMACSLHRSLKAAADQRKLTPALIDELLANVAKQTGLTLRRERRVVPMWTWQPGTT